MVTDLSVSSLQCGLVSPTESCVTPASYRSLLLRSNSLRLQLFEERTGTRVWQLLEDRPESLSLMEKNALRASSLICCRRSYLSYDLQSSLGGCDHWAEPEEALI